MSDESRLISLPLFPPEYRASGLLLHVTSLPSPYGIGDVGPAALKWIDRLHDAGQSWWQSLPLGPTGYGNSPYQSLSSFAGNGWFAARPSGTENIYKIYAESFKSQNHLDAIVSEAQEIVNDALKAFDSAHQREAR